jgi:Flp pilus assembly protein CpaB
MKTTLVIAIAALTIAVLATWIVMATSRQPRSTRASTSVSPHRGKQGDAIKQS